MRLDGQSNSFGLARMEREEKELMERLQRSQAPRGIQRASMFYPHKQQFTTFIASSPYTTAWFTEFCPENSIQRCATEHMPKLSKSVESHLGNLAEERHRVAYMQLEAWLARKSDLGQSSHSRSACTYLTTSAEAVKFYCQKRRQLCSEAFSEISLHLKSRHS